MHHLHKLQDKLGMHPVGAPKSKEFLEILEILFQPEEIEVAVCLDFTLQSATDVAAQAEIPVADVSDKLEAMANRGVILSKTASDVAVYALLPNYPGLFEYPIMKGMEPAVQKRLAELWHAYYMKDMAAELALAKPPWTRVFPAEQGLEYEDVEIIPYERASKLMEKTRDIALARCPCRILGQNCEKPLDVCLSFDGAARFLVERGMAKSIGRAEALIVLRRAEEAGLVHTGSNISDRLMFICNCCSCCCHMLMLLTRHGYEEGIARSAYQIHFHPHLCQECGICAEERCPVGAISILGGRTVVQESKCIGCGLCVTTCSPGALRLVPREQHRQPPVSAVDLVQQIMTNKAKKQLSG